MHLPIEPSVFERSRDSTIDLNVTTQIQKAYGLIKDDYLYYHSSRAITTAILVSAARVFQVNSYVQIRVPVSNMFRSRSHEEQEYSDVLIVAIIAIGHD